MGGATVAGGLLLFRRRSRRPLDPAEELRRKLAETRQPAVAPALAPPVIATRPLDLAAPRSEKPSEKLDRLRHDVHERGRAAAEEMRGTSSDE